MIGLIALQEPVQQLVHLANFRSHGCRLVLPWCYDEEKFRRDEGDVVTLRVRAKKRIGLRWRRVLAAVKKN